MNDRAPDRDLREHPTRARILETFAELPGGHLTPTTFAVESGEPLSHVAYHFRVLADHGELEAADEVAEPGERPYRLSHQGRSPR